MSRFCLSAMTALTAVLSAPAFGSFTRFTPMDYGVLQRYDSQSTPMVQAASLGNLPDGNMGLQVGSHWQLGGYRSEGVAAFSPYYLGNYSHYYAVISPISQYSGNELAPRIDLFTDCCGPGADFEVTAADWDLGAEWGFVGSAAVTNPSDASWYSPNSFGGFSGDTYIDITDFVKAGQGAGDAYLTLRYVVSGYHPDPNAPFGWYSGVILRPPVILGVNAPIPAPATAPLLALAGLTARGRRRR